MDQRVQNVLTRIENNFAEHLSETDLARAVNLSPWRLCHLFKTETNMAPQQYLRAVRMERAKSLLETTFLSVKQIMTEVGLRDKGHFVRDFKITYGLPPAKFRTHFLIVNSERNSLIKSASKFG
jgi:transcriptional regulator GlxA family with amidase domain